MHPGALNNSGTVTFLANGGPSGTGIYSGSGGPLTTVISSGNVYQLPDINDAGTVALTEQFLGLVTGNGGPLTQVAAGYGPAINDLGHIAFLGFSNSSVPGIYLTDGVSQSLVVQQGDPLDGSTIQQFIYSYASINNHDQIAFSAYLADGREGIWVANPVPEPASATLLSIAGIMMVGWRFVRRRSRTD